MPIVGERLCSCVLALVVIILAPSLVGEAKAQSLPDGLEEHYRDCVGVTLSEIDAPSIFEGDHLRALPAPLQTDLDLGIAAGNCLSDATGNPWAYDPYLYRFRTGTQFQLDLALNAQGRALEARQQEERASDAARIAAEIALVERERRAAVWLATRDACVALYQDDTVAALTNQICQPLFLEIGLPSD